MICHALLIGVAVFVHVLIDHQPSIRVVVQVRLVEREETVVEAPMHVLSVQQVVQQPTTTRCD
jgi:hypothetical protein